MADLAQLETALINADKAGDTEAARILASEIQKIRQQPEKTNGITRQLGLSGRYAIEGPMEALGVFTNPIAYGLNKAGLDVPYAGKTGSAFADMLGLPKPETDVEKGVAFGSKLLSGLGGQAALANQGAKVATGGTRRVLESLGGQPQGALDDRIRQSVNPAVRTLLKEGVKPTPGQVIGGVAKRAEESARSVPFLGDTIVKAQARGVDQFNRAAINRVLNPIGQAMGKNDGVGYKAVEKARTAVDDAYGEILPKLKINADNAFRQDVLNVKDNASTMVPTRAAQLNNILRDALSKFDSTGSMPPKVMKRLDSKLGKQASDGLKSLDMDQQQLGQAVAQLQGSLRSMVERANPTHNKELQKVNQAFANLLRVENAAARQGAKGGVFTPNQLEAATRAMDRSLRKRASAQGKALMQDLATAGDEVIANKLPSSGTVERALFNLGGLASGTIHPAIPAGLMAGAGLYTRPGQSLMTGLLTSKGPAALDPVTSAIRAGSPLISGLLAQ